MKGLNLALISEADSKILVNINKDFFKDITNLKKVKLLCNLFKISKAIVYFNKNEIVFYKDDNSIFYTLSGYRSDYILVSRVTNNNIVDIKIIDDLTCHAKNNGYAHRFSSKNFISGNYTEDVLDYLENYSLSNYKISCEFHYKVNEESIILGSDEHIITVDDLYDI